MKLFKYLLLIFIFLGFISCNNDDDVSINQGITPTPTGFSQNFGNQISRTFLGNVVDVNNNPIEGVSISIGSLTTITDSNGVFIIQNAPVHERFGYVKAEKIGYIHGSRAVVPSEGTNKVTIMLLETTVTGTTNSGTTETISMSNGASVALEGNYIKEDGSTYSGSVDVIIHHLDPTDENMTDQMPGMLYAENALGEERMLQTFGMLAVELRGSNGEDLNLAEGSTAEIRVPVDASLIATAPSTIPLWYFDEVNGYWIEDGEATLVGNAYIGTVSHFSFWNCDIPAEAVNLCVTVLDEDSNPLVNMLVSITSDTYGTRYGYTNEIGEACGLVPSNETLGINVYSYNICGSSPIYLASIGPFASDSASIIIVNNDFNIISETVIGTFNTCDENPVTSGYVLLDYGNQQFTTLVNNGDFEVNLIRCTTENTFSITGIDYDNLQTSDVINYTFFTPITDIGNIVSCNSVTEFIQYTIDNGEIEYLSINSINAEFQILSNSHGFIYINTQFPNVCFYLAGYLSTTPPYTGIYTNRETFTENETGFYFEECPYISNTNNNILYNLTTLGDVGEFIDIYFSGNYEDFQGNPHTINGIIHVLRDQ